MKIAIQSGKRTLMGKFVCEVFGINAGELRRITTAIGNIGEKRANVLWFNSDDCDAIADYLGVARK